MYCISSVIRQFFFFQNNPKNIDPSYKMDRGLWDCLAGNTLEGDVSNIIALDQPTLLFSPRKATRMSP